MMPRVTRARARGTGLRGAPQVQAPPPPPASISPVPSATSSLLDLTLRAGGYAAHLAPHQQQHLVVQQHQQQQHAGAAPPRPPPSGSYSLSSSEEHEHAGEGGQQQQQSALVHNLQPGRAYWFRVRAVNACGASPPCCTLHPVAMDAAPPPPPQRLGAVVAGGRGAGAVAHAKVKWEPPAECNGAQVSPAATLCRALPLR